MVSFQPQERGPAAEGQELLRLRACPQGSSWKKSEGSYPLPYLHFTSSEKCSGVSSFDQRTSQTQEDHPQSFLVSKAMKTCFAPDSSWALRSCYLSFLCFSYFYWLHSSRSRSSPISCLPSPRKFQPFVDSNLLGRVHKQLRIVIRRSHVSYCWFTLFIISFRRR